MKKLGVNDRHLLALEVLRNTRTTLPKDSAHTNVNIWPWLSDEITEWKSNRPRLWRERRKRRPVGTSADFSWGDISKLEMLQFLRHLRWPLPRVKYPSSYKFARRAQHRSSVRCSITFSSTWWELSKVLKRCCISKTWNTKLLHVQSANPAMTYFTCGITLGLGLVTSLCSLTRNMNVGAV